MCFERKRMIFVFCALLIFTVQNASCGQQCMSCSGIQQESDCQHFSDCFDNEVCYMHSYSVNGVVMYDYGCGARQTCSFIAEPIIGRRSADHHAICTECCNATRLCNSHLQFNNQQTIPKNQQCMSCNGISNSKDCRRFIDCFDNEVIQRRIDGTIDFYKNWTQYQNGFGSANGEYWIGNDILHALTSYANHTLRIELEDFNNVTKYAEYAVFYVADESDKYRLTVTNYSGNAGDCLYRCSDYGNA